jgi:hypothetical protein
MPFYHYRRVSGNVYDVFFDNGWEDWSRITVGPSYARVVSGNWVSPKVLKELNNTIMGL